MWCNWSTMGPWGWAIMAGSSLLIILLLVWGARTATRAAPPDRANRGLQILDERLAKGEIEPGDYQQRRAVLEGRP